MTDTPRLAALNLVDHRENGSLLGVIAKRTYQVRNQRCVVADEQVALVEAPVPSPDGLLLTRDIDVALQRSHVDVVVLGKAYADKHETQLELLVEVGALTRRLLVLGKRIAYRDTLGRVRFSEPEPIESVELGWASAYGGTDHVALKKYGDPLERFHLESGRRYDPRMGSFSYPRNRAGKGYIIDASSEALEACELPNLEDPGRRILPETLAIGRPDHWPAGAPVAALGYLPYHFFPRCAMLALVPNFDRASFPPLAFFEVRDGVLNPDSIADRIALPRRLDLAVAQHSALGMRVLELEPTAAISLSHVHPTLPNWRFSLPGETPRLGLKLPDAPAVELAPKIRSIVLEPELNRVSVTWIGEHRVATPVGPGKFAKTTHGVQW